MTSTGRISGKFKRFGVIMLALMLLAGVFPSGLPGTQAASEGDYEYVLLGGKVTITAYHGPGGDLVIPGFIAGYPVVAIGDRAFREKKLTSVTIPDNVTHIRYDAFVRNNLVAISIGYNVIDIDLTWTVSGWGAFGDNPEFIVHCYQDSYAHNYFRKHHGGSQFVLTPLPSYTVTFKDGDRVLNTQRIRHGFNASSPAAPAKSGYAFNGWNRQFSNITQNITVNATWRRVYTVTFKDRGRQLKKQTVNQNASASAPSIPTRKGYNFAGWDRGFGSVTKNLTVNAKWKAKTIRLKFDALDGKIGKKKTVTVKRKFGQMVSLPKTPKRRGYKFGGWRVSRTASFSIWHVENAAYNGSGKKVTKKTKVPANSTTYYARWTRR
ncbi:MAG: InlB B-repeat-containing protein [Oscillospiraceae bacterium]|nr:InlB B-repeat-containing protein [Oscillospiraceae bacterium]